MAKVEASFLDIHYLDRLSYGNSPIHRLDPRVKLATSFFFIILVVSFNKYEIVGLVPFFAYPLFLIILGDLPVMPLIRKVLLAAPFAFFIGIFNPLFDRANLVHIGNVGISGGWISFGSVMLRFLLTVSAALILIATTGFSSICIAAGKMGVPKAFVTQLLFLYRYIFVLIDEAARMSRARSLRSFGRKGLGLRVYANLIGQLLMRTLDRAQRIHLAMCCRAFDGEIRTVRFIAIGRRDVVFLVGWAIFLPAMRFFNIPQWIGRLAMELMG